MPKPAHTRVTFEGVIGTVALPLEKWAFGINFPANAIPANATDSVADAVAANVAGAYDVHLQERMTTDNILTRVKVIRVGADGLVEKRADGSYIQGQWDGSLVGTQVALPMPLQTALCVSLVTARSGATGKGRFFLPWPANSIEASTKRLSAANANMYSIVAKDFLNAVATVLTFPPQVVSSKGYMSQVTAVKVGRVPDTMRSRRADLPEEYAVTPLA